MKVTTQVRYAITAMVGLALLSKDKKPVSLSVLAQTHDLSLAYLEQLFLNLKRLGLVQSVRGPRGGYLLAKPATTISLFDIMRGVGREVRMTQCTETSRCLGHTKCLTHELWEGLERHIETYLQSITLDDVCMKNFPDQKACQQFLVKAYASKDFEQYSSGGVQ